MQIAVKLRSLFLFLGILISFSGLSQEITTHIDKKQHFIISAGYGYGNVIPTNLFVKGDNLQNHPITDYSLLSFKILWQNPGYMDWQRLYKGPYYGFGISKGDFGNPSEIGFPHSYYGILGLPLSRFKKLELFTEFQFGLTSNWRSFDLATNPKNVAIGGALTVHLDLALKMFYQLNPRLDLGAGFSFIHFSNGGLKRPNRGFNIFAPHAELRYRFEDRPDYKSLESTKKTSPSGSIFFMRTGSVHQLVEFEPDTNYFAVYGWSLVYLQQISNKLRLGIGRDMNYWWGMTANSDGTMGERTVKNLSVGYILQSEMILNDLSLIGGVGIYAAHMRFGSFNQFYQRLGIRYDVYKTLSLGVNIRAIKFSLAEFMEFNIGYRLQWEQ